ncbi:MAG: alanine racemase [Bdellovibrio sp.]|nr:alanine racemase [Bdellovibrio sp.]
MKTCCYHHNFFCEDRVVADLSKDNLRQNYLVIQKQLKTGQKILPMVKADAYGHGATWVAKQLLNMPNLYGFGVATLEEGRDLRLALGERNTQIKIIIFSGCLPWCDSICYFCKKFDLTAVISSDEDWLVFYKHKWPGRISYELKFNTGMNRLGINLDFSKNIIQNLKNKPVKCHPQGVLSHLSCAENPGFHLSRQQLWHFEELIKYFSVFDGTCFHLANSAAIWNAKEWKIHELTHVVRPGISLYGILPWAGAPHKGLKPVLRLKSKVIAIHDLHAGEYVGYGGSYLAKKKHRIAVLAIGYADGLHRSLGGINNGNAAWSCGKVWLSEKFCSILGIINMDLCVVECSRATKVGDDAVILGPPIDIWEQAKKAHTVPYELLTSLSKRVKRNYV